jgi:hypothetical protein
LGTQLCTASVRCVTTNVAYVALQDSLLASTSVAPTRLAGSAASLATPRLRQVGEVVHRDGQDEGFLATDKVEATLLECMQQLDFWLLTFSVAACTGASLAFINNVGPLVASLHGENAVTVCPTNACVLLLCCFVLLHGSDTC